MLEQRKCNFAKPMIIVSYSKACHTEYKLNKVIHAEIFGKRMTTDLCDFMEKGRKKPCYIHNY
jgi:hypothetical protein